MTKSKRNQRKRELTTRACHPDAAGIDIGAEELMVAVSAERAEDPVRAFSSFTGDLHALRDWLLECRIRTVAIESTGNYWVAIYQILEDAGLEVFLVQARHVKGVPGRKSDVCDAAWLQQLHCAGLLRKSFRPSKEIVPLRYLMRHRRTLIASGSSELQLMQKTLTEMNLHLHHVLSDLDGKSGQAIVEAILAGQRDPHRLAELCDRRCKTPRAQVEAAMEGDYREEYLFVLKQCYARWQAGRVALGELDAEITRSLETIGGVTEEPLPPAPSSQRRARKNTPAAPLVEESFRIYGVDLGEAPGVSAITMGVLISELGTGAQILEAFPSVARFCSWLGLCPDNRISGGRVLKAKTRAVANRVADALRMAAQSAAHSHCAIGDHARRMKARLGKAEGVTATAHKLARILYAMIATRTPYRADEARRLPAKAKANRVRNIKKQAAALGFKLTPLQKVPC